MTCPICGKPIAPPADPRNPPPFFPFCSDRCRLIDLGRWLDGKYQIPVTEADASSESDE